MSRSSLSGIGTSLRNAGKALEILSLQYRSYFVPSHILTYREMLKKHSTPPAQNGHKFAFFDFTRAEIDNVGGRYLYTLVRDFEALGLRPVFRKNFCFLATMRYKRFKSFLLNRPFHICPALDSLPAGSVEVEVTDRRKFPVASTHRQVRVRYEAVWPKSDREIPMTFSVHPALYDDSLTLAPPDLEGIRPWRIFFAGRVRGKSKKYGLDRLPRNFGKMSRLQIIETLEQSLPPERSHWLAQASDLEPGAIPQPCFLWSDMLGYRIPRQDWMKMLARADFFLGCPGMDMPLCHNLIEAFSRGAIPILEHPEFLDPPLEHGVNCLSFRGREELIRAFDHAFQLNPDQVRRLRRGAYTYYQQHLAPGQFARRLITQPNPPLDLLFNSFRTRRFPA